MSSIASRQSHHPRSRLPSVVLLAILLVATPRLLHAQRRTTTPDSQTTPKRSTSRQDDASPRDSSVWQRLVTAVVEGLSPRDSTSARPKQQPGMPNLVGMDTASALQRLGLRTRAQKPWFSYVIVFPPATQIPIDSIVDQSPAVGTPVSRGMNVRLILAGVPRPPALAIVPPLVGLLPDSAERMLSARGFVEDRLEKGTKAPDSIGRVVGQNPQAGTRVAPGRTVAISIGTDARVKPPSVAGTTPAPPNPTTSTAPRTVLMPGVIGRDTATATRILRKAGLSNLRFRVPVNGTVVDTVRVQTPDSGQRVSVARVVVLTLRASVPIDPIPRPALPTTERARRSRPPWLPASALALFIIAASALTARRIWPPPQIVPHVSVEPSFTDILGVRGSLVDVSVSLRSHVEHEQAMLDLVGSPSE